MRPVNRGAAPRTYEDYTHARSDLVQAIGNFCSYCERPFPEDVEHKLPKARYPDLKVEWDNLLLACKSCNGTKNKQVLSNPPDPGTDLARYLWPDTDNTARAYVYARAEIKIAPGLSDAQAELAQATMDLTGFHKTPGSPAPPASHKDRRWFYRDEAWSLAEICFGRIQADPDNLALRHAILDVAMGAGFWSVWRAVFAEDTEMLRLLDQAFTGTSPECIEPRTRALIARGGGRM